MKVKSFVVAGLVAAAIAPAYAQDCAEAAKNGAIFVFCGDNAIARAKELAQDVSKNAKQMTCLAGGSAWYNDKCYSISNCSKDANCVTAFEDIQVSSGRIAADLVTTYVQNVLGWNGCAGGLEIPKSKALGDDFIMCKRRTSADSEVRIFQFDDMSESVNSLAAKDYARGKCFAIGGKVSKVNEKGANAHVVCTGVDAEVCKTAVSGTASGKNCQIKIL